MAIWLGSTKGPALTVLRAVRCQRLLCTMYSTYLGEEEAVQRQCRHQEEVNAITIEAQRGRLLLEGARSTALFALLHQMPTIPLAIHRS
jgi:hypothetical protein